MLRASRQPRSSGTGREPGFLVNLATAEMWLLGGGEAVGGFWHTAFAAAGMRTNTIRNRGGLCDLRLAQRCTSSIGHSARRG